MFDLGLKEHEKRQEEISSFFGSIKEAREDNKQQGVKCIDDYCEYKKKVIFLKHSPFNANYYSN